MKFIDDELLEKILYGILVVLLIAIIGILLFKDFGSEELVSDTDDVVAITTDTKEEVKQEKTIDKKIKVDVKGAVKKEGVYELEYGSRVNDAIKAAGGLKSNASTKYLNLSKKIDDETVIKVYTETQIKNMNITYEVKEECECPTQEIIDCAGANIIEDSTNDEVNVNTNSDSNDSNNEQNKEENKVDTNENKDSKISINNGSKDELMTLNGIGESKANAIIEYRIKNNGFKTLEDIMNVSGIGEAAFNKIKDNIKL